MSDLRPVVFLCHDHVIGDLFDQIAHALAAQGIEVIRGPHTLPGSKLRYPEASLDALFARADVAMFSSRSICDERVLQAAPRLRGIVNPTVGLETVDVPGASARAILVGHSATPINTIALAEATVMLILMQLYDPNRSRAVLLGSAERPNFSNRWARQLAGRTVGIVGLGRIGKEVAKRLAGFGVRVLASSRPGTLPDTRDTPAVTPVDLATLLRESDVVTLHLTLSPESANLIGAAELALMKPTAHLVNTARGDAIDEEALCDALRQGRLAGAALDTFKSEPLPANSPLRRLDNAYLTPHLVAMTRDSAEVLPRIAIENILRLLRGEPPLYCKNPEVIPAWRQRFADAPLRVQRRPDQPTDNT